MTCPKKGCGAKMCYLCKEPVQVETFDIDHRGGGMKNWTYAGQFFRVFLEFCN